MARIIVLFVIVIQSSPLSISTTARRSMVFLIAASLSCLPGTTDGIRSRLPFFFLLRRVGDLIEWARWILI